MESLTMLGLGKRNQQPTPAPEEQARAIIAKAEAQAIVAKSRAEAKATVWKTQDDTKTQRRRRREQERVERGKRPFSMTGLSLWLVKVTAVASVIAAFGFIAVGFLFDVLFYKEQATDPLVVGGLIIFAVAARLLEAAVPVVLQWSKPGAEPGLWKRRLALLKVWEWGKPQPPPPPPNPLAEPIARSPIARAGLSILFLMAVVCSFIATLSFFSSGHETRTYAAAGAKTVTEAQVSTKAERKAELEKQRTAAQGVRDSSVKAATLAMDAIKDQVKGTSAADNATLQQMIEKIDGYNKAFEARSKEIDAAILAVDAEVEGVQVGAAQEAASKPTFLSVWRFLARFASNEEDLTVSGAVYFSAFFELAYAFLLALLFPFLSGISFVARLLQVRDRENVMKWEQRFSKLELEAEIEKMEFERVRAATEAQVRLQMALDQASRSEAQAAADRQVAEIQRRIDKANAQAEAARLGKPWIDPDEEIEAQRVLAEAEQKKRIAETRAKAEAALVAATRAAEPPPAQSQAPPPSEPDPATAKQTGSSKGGQSTQHGNRMDKIPPRKIRVDDWSNRDVMAGAVP